MYVTTGAGRVSCRRGARPRGILGALALGILGACGADPVLHYEGTGVVASVQPEAAQVRIAHEEIPGFMSAMTMSFDVADRELLSAVQPGSRVRFRLERRPTSLRITSLEVQGSGAVPALRALDAPPEQAPDFALIDQDGRVRALADLRGSAVLLDFIFTRCPGPCPILTSAHVETQRMLPRELAARTRFVSVSIDPEYDTPARMRAYARERGVDLTGWDFLTGEPAVVQDVLDDYGVGTIRQPDGTLDHVVVTFLIDPAGRIAHRYLGLDHPSDKIVRDLREVLS